MLEESSATLHRWKSELSSAIENMNFPVQKKVNFPVQQLGHSARCGDIALHLPFPVIPQVVFFLCAYACCLVTVFGKFFVSLFIFFGTMCLLCLYFVQQ